jgi:hypothetical protein
MTAQFSTPTDELLLLAETLGEVKSRTEKLETEFSTQARPLEAATNALSAALSGIKALQFHVLDNNLGALSARVEEMRKAVDEQVGVIALELKKADETNAAKAGADAEALRSEIVALQSQLGSLVTQFGQQLERVEFAAKEEAKKLQLIPGPAGAAGASLNPRGTFIDGETYNRLDVVSWLGSSYIATVDGVKEKPSKNSNQWQTLASRGGGGAGGVGDFGSLAGVAQINQGGTGQTTRVAALNALLPDQAGSTQYMLLTDGSGTVSWGAQPVAGLPSQTSNSGRLLTTNGSTASWSNAVTVSGSNATVGGTLTVTNTVTAGGLIQSEKTSQANDTSALFFNAVSGADATLGALRIGFGARPSATGANRYGYISVGDDAAMRPLSLSDNGSGTYGQVLIRSTTASTSTSSGALVVGNGTSGGLGVGGAIYAGGDIITTKSNGVIKASGSSANAEVAAERLTTTPSSVSMVAAVSQPQLAFTSDTAGSYTWGRILANSSEIVRVHSANLAAIANVAGAGIAVAGGIINTGSLTTGAPAGGTAAAWKLGTVATVSPTSPNRTIEVDIGGTIYYIHAKTTNN